MAGKQEKSESGLQSEDVDGNVDKIREILFGGQMRDYEQRFADMESRLTKNMDLIAANIEKRLERMDNFARREFEKLSEKVKEERNARRDEGKQGSRDLKALTKQIESSLAELEEQVGGETHELRTLLQNQGEEMSGLINDVHDQLSRRLAENTRHLSDGKLDRSDLAVLLSEVADRLKKQPKA